MHPQTDHIEIARYENRVGRPTQQWLLATIEARITRSTYRVVLPSGERVVVEHHQWRVPDWWKRDR